MGVDPFLFIASRLMPGGGKAGSWQLDGGRLNAGVDETLILEAAVRHKVTGRLLSALRREGNPDHGGLVRALAARNLPQRAMRMRILAVLPELSRAFEARGMRLLGLKGPAASLQLYGDPLVREGTDLDVLTDSNDLESIIAAMGEAGFSLEMPFTPASAEWEPDFTRKATKQREEREAPRGAGARAATERVDDPTKDILPHHTTFWKKGEPFRVECHSPQGQDSAGFDEAAMRAFISRAKTAHSRPDSSVSWSCPTLDEVDHALFLIAHGVQHAWCSLHWFFDLVAIIELAEPEFHERLAKTAKRLDMGRKLELSLRVYRMMTGRPVPEALELAGVRAGAGGRARTRNWAGSGLWSGILLRLAVRYAARSLREGGARHATFLDQLAMMLVYKPSLAASFEEWLRAVTGPLMPSDQDRAIVPLPRSLDFLLIILRPWVVMYKKGRRFLARRRFLAQRRHPGRAGMELRP